MKVYTIKVESPNRYISSNHQALHVSWSGNISLDMVSDISDARHYKSRSQAKHYLKNIQLRYNKLLKSIHELSKNHSFRKAEYLKHFNDAKATLTPIVQGLVVDEYEIESLDETNVHEVKNKRLEFMPYYKNNSRVRGITIETETTKRHHCKCCGVFLKNIPQVKINGIFGGVICCHCAINIGEQAKQKWDSLSNKDELNAEFFMENL